MPSLGRKWPIIILEDSSRANFRRSKWHPQIACWRQTELVTTGYGDSVDFCFSIETWNSIAGKKAYFRVRLSVRINDKGGVVKNVGFFGACLAVIPSLCLGQYEDQDIR